MTERLDVSPRAIVVTRDIAAYPPETERRFRADAALWVPGRIVMNAATTFHTRLRVLGARRELELVVGTPWDRGTVTTRRLRVEIYDPPPALAWALPVVDGELMLLRGEQHASLRFEGSPDGRGPFGVRVLTGRRLLRAALADVADRLAAPHPPPRPSQAPRT